MNVDTLPLWVTLPGSVLLTVGALAVLLGSIGLLRFKDFFARMHGPSMGATLGAGCIVGASMLTSSAVSGGPLLHELVIALLVFATAPVTSMMLMQAALYRNRVRGGEDRK